MNVFGPLAFALIAAFGNAMFAVGQKKAVVLDNTLLFVACSGAVCVLLTVLVAPVFGDSDYIEMLRQNSKWIILSGVGLFLTYLGFNLLYSNYGASNYILYAVISIITTSIFVGALIFKESLNIYHWVACLTAVITIILFSMGNLIGSNS
ncbi:EamA family transporter [Shewanella algae]|uniref:EamA family transporter n=1 Tax=Shewanella algae TaxID=38313 RepID=UPI001AAC92D4|nr:EamA family transporter [Shewanella algae]MBO2688336.1 EamA family transporter [Shewanella algae]